MKLKYAIKMLLMFDMIASLIISIAENSTYWLLLSFYTAFILSTILRDEDETTEKDLVH